MTQLYYEDINEGQELPSVVEFPTTMQLVKYAAASGDYYQIHYDKDIALANGLPGVIVHGWLALSFLGKMVTGWIGENGQLVKINGSYRGMNNVHEELFCFGKVNKKYQEENTSFAKLDIWVENPGGEKTVTGTAIVSLPGRFGNA